MYWSRLTLTGAEPPSPKQAELVHDAIWAHLPDAHLVEHITATATPNGIDLVLFLHHSVENADQYAQRLVDAIIKASPVLSALRSTPTL